MRRSELIILLVSLLIVLCMASYTNASPEDYTETPELWTCGAWDYTYFATSTPIESSTRYPAETNPISGKYCVALNYDGNGSHWLSFPTFKNADWDLSGVEYLEFQVKVQKGVNYGPTNPTIYLKNHSGSFFRIRPADRGSLFTDGNGDDWKTIRVPLCESEGWEILNWLDASMKHIDYLEIAFNGGVGREGLSHHVLVDGVRFGPNPVPYTSPNTEAGDLDVLIIERNPKYERYQIDDTHHPEGEPDVPLQRCKNIDAKHHPDTGEEVTFTATVQNKGKSPLGGKFVWVLDGKEVANGKLPKLAPREKKTFDLKWNWDPADHDLTFKVTPDGEDYCSYNDELTIRTNALMYKFIIEKGALNQMERKFNMYGSLSCEDWLQGQLRYMNQLFAESKYDDFAPNGITQRVMAGKFVYVEDGEMVALGEGPFVVGELDLSLDGGRGLTAFDNPWGPGTGGIHEYLNFIGDPDDAWLHELSHQIGVIDDYQLITPAENNKVNGVGFGFKHKGLMGGGEVDPHPTLDALYNLYSPNDVHALNVTKGKRRGYFGEYLFCIPKENTLVVLDKQGNPIKNAEIKVYQTQGRVINDTAFHEGKTDANGKFALKNRKAEQLTTETGCTLTDNPFGNIHVVGFNGVFLVTVKTADKDMYGFTTILEFNRAWDQGHKDNAEIPVVLKEKGDEKIFYLCQEGKLER